MNKSIKLLNFIILIGLISCKPDVDRSLDPFLLDILKPKSSTELLSISYAPKSYSFAEKVAIATITPISTGSIATCSASSILPTGLSIDNSCNISGTPTIIQPEATYSITATNGTLTATDSITISITATAVTVPVNSFVYPGAPYSFTQGVGIVPVSPTLNGSFISFSISPSLPAGLFLNNTTGQITGGPSGLSASTLYTVTGTLSDGTTSSFSFNLAAVEVAPSAFSYAGTPFIFTQLNVISPANPTITGTPATCNSVPTLPTGLSINTSCIITGNPSVIQAGTSYTITATNTGGSTSTVINITVTSSANKKIFVTSSGYLPAVHFTNPASADTLCNSDAGKPVGGGTYKAMIAHLGVRVACATANCVTLGVVEHIDWVFAVSTPYYQADGITLIATTNANGLMPATFTNVATANAKYWTGLNTNWTLAANNCINWGSAGASSTCGGASPNNDSTRFTDIWGVVACGAAQQLLCVQQ